MIAQQNRQQQQQERQDREREQQEREKEERKTQEREQKERDEKQKREKKEQDWQQQQSAGPSINSLSFGYQIPGQQWQLPHAIQQQMANYFNSPPQQLRFQPMPSQSDLQHSQPLDVPQYSQQQPAEHQYWHQIGQQPPGQQPAEQQYLQQQYWQPQHIVVQEHVSGQPQRVSEGQQFTEEQHAGQGQQVIAEDEETIPL